MLQEKIKEFGITKVAAALNITEMCLRNKMSGKNKLYADEWAKLQTILQLTLEEITTIELELRIRGDK